MNIEIIKEYDKKFDFDEERVIREVISQAVEECNCPYEIMVEVILTNNDEIHKINLEQRQIDRATDVLSFPMAEYETPCDFEHVSEDCFEPDTGEFMIGDIVLSLDKVVSQAKEYGHSQKREFAFLIAHSMLHLFGYDHMTEEEAKIMEEKQKKILDELGIQR